MINPIVSVIIPLSKWNDLMDEMVFSIQSQTFQNWECLLIFDGLKESIHSSTSFFKNDERVKIFYRDEKLTKGANSCRNYGFRISNGNFIQWFDSDDLMHPEFLESKIQAFSNSSADFVVCKGSIFEGKVDNQIGNWDKLDGKAPLVDQALGNINFQTNAPMFRRDFLEGKKLWDEKLQRKQDYEFFNRILSLSTNYKIIDKNLFFYRQHSRSINGINYPTTIRSMILADLLVYNNTIQTINDEYKRFEFQQHFFRKIIFRCKLARRNRYLVAYFKGLGGAISIIDLNYLKNYFKRK